MKKKYNMLILGVLTLLAGVFSARAQTPGGINMSPYTLDLWVDGNHSTDASWPNISSAGFTLVKFSNNAPIVRTSRLNYQKEIYFGNTTSSKLRTSANYTLASGNTYHIFVVSDARANASSDAVLLTFGNSATNSNLRWNSSATSILSSYWTSGTANHRQTNFSAADHPRYGISTMNIANTNSTTNGFELHLNGRKATWSLGTGTAGASTQNNPLMLGNASTSTANGSTNPLNGSVQEIIVMRRNSSTVLMVDAELDKIHTYLAVKYGISLSDSHGGNAKNYVISDNTVVWHTANASSKYNYNIFGLGRDNASGIHQRQSQSSNDPTLTVFVGGAIAPLNNDNKGSLADKQFLMLGSNGVAGYADYEYDAGEEFSGVAITEDINYRGGVIYYTELTNVPAMQVKMKVNAPNVKYLLVCPDDQFNPSNTIAYPVALDGTTLGDVTINGGEYISYAGYMSTPAGINNSNYTWNVWLTPDSYNDGTWINKVAGNSSAGTFSVSPAVANYEAPEKVAGLNYHPAADFTKTQEADAFNRLVSAKPMTISRNENITAIFVYEKGSVNLADENANPTNNDNLFAFNNSNQSHTLVFQDNNSDNLNLFWPGTNRGPLTTDGTGIFSVSLANNGTSGPGRAYNNGVEQQFTGNWTAATGPTSQWTLGANSPAVAAGNGYAGKIQEVIILRAPGPNNLIDIDHLRKIHTYLAVKYGISLSGTDYELYNTDGIAPLNIWNQSINTPYTKNIFGIGRDDMSMLNQVQSTSATNSSFTIFLDELVEWNNDNTAFENNTLDDKQFLLIGSDGAFESLSNVAPGTSYADGTFIDPEIAPLGLNVAGSKYKAQLTNATTMTVNMQVSGYIYCFVSTSPNFEPANTKAYPIGEDNFIHDVEISTTYQYITFGGMKIGPGGVPVGLAMWLRADDINSLTLQPDMELADYDTNSTMAWMGLGAPSSTQTGVTEWRDTDPYRTTVYRKNDSHASIRTPVYIDMHYLMNYHPAVDFYTNWNNLSAFLSTTRAPMSTGKPANSTTFMIMNSAVKPGTGVGANTYMISWHSPQVLTGYTQYLPTFGIQGNNGEGKARMRFNGALDFSDKAFNPGSTTISAYQLSNVPPTGAITAGNIVSAFNMFETRSTTNRTTSATWYMNGNGSLAGSRYHSRSMRGLFSEVVQYEKVLDDEEKAKVNSYYAFKYGITLRPNTSGYSGQRFDYKLSNDVMVWPGSSGSAPYTTYYNNLAALIRDDRAALHNNQTHSTDIGSLLHIGLAGEYLSFDGHGSLGDFEYDDEVVMFGDNHLSGITVTKDDPKCGDFDNIFNRLWYVHKKSEGDRPLPIIFGLQNNAANNLGTEVSPFPTEAYYNQINKSNDFVMIVAKDPSALVRTNPNYGNFDAVVPMYWLNGEPQCIYTIVEEGTYITFGYKQNSTGCMADEDAIFTEPKQFTWEQWTPAMNTSNNPGPFTFTVNTPVDLGDNISVVKTEVTYPSGVRANRGYPRSVNSPERGSLNVRRRGGLGQSFEVSVTVTFNHPVIPEFKISGIDCSGSRGSYEEVEITGDCEGGTFMPTLTYAGNPANARYKISGNRATASRTGSMNANNVNGKVNVEFRGGVTSVTIKYRATGRPVTSTQQIFISPFTLKPAPLPPTVNEDGLSLQKEVEYRNYTTCDLVRYRFYIGNVNCDPKTVDFSDILPEGMMWAFDKPSDDDPDSPDKVYRIGLDPESAELNPDFNPQVKPAASGNGEELYIEEFVIPPTSTAILTAYAMFDEDMPQYPGLRTFDNNAGITYELIVDGKPVQHAPFYSEDRYTGDPYTSIEVEWKERDEEVTLVPTYSKSEYREGDIITVSYTLTNENVDIPDMFLDIDFNEEFEYVEGSFTATQLTGTPVTPVPVRPTPDPDDSPNTLSIAGSANGETGFVLPTGTMKITYQLKAPAAKTGLVYELDDLDQPTENVVDLDVMYYFSSLVEDPCLQRAIMGLQGNKLIPYGSGKNAIITNRNVTTIINKLITK